MNLKSIALNCGLNPVPNDVKWFEVKLVISLVVFKVSIPIPSHSSRDSLKK